MENLNQMLKWLTYPSVADQVYLALLLLSTVVTAVKYQRVSYNLRPLLWLSIAHLLGELITDYIHFIKHEDNMYIYHLLIPIEYVIISIIFYRTFLKHNLRKWVLLSIPIYIILVLLYSITWEPLSENNPLSFITEGILATYWCFSFFRESLSRQLKYRPEKDRTFWIVIAVLFYYVGKFFILGGINYFDKMDRELAGKIYYAGYAFNYLLYFTITLVCLIHFPRISYD